MVQTDSTIRIIIHPTILLKVIVGIMLAPDIIAVAAACALCFSVSIRFFFAKWDFFIHDIKPINHVYYLIGESNTIL